MKSDFVEQILTGSDKAELLEDFSQAMETAHRVVIMVAEPAEMDDGGAGERTFYYLFGFRQLYEVDRFIRQMHDRIMEDD